MEKWRTALATSDATSIHICGYDMTELMLHRSFADTVFLLHRQRLPGVHEKRLLDAILISSADHGSGAPSCATARLVASGNRQSLSAAVAAGILAIGDAHGGAGAASMEMIAEGLEMARSESISIAAAAAKMFREARVAKKRLPGLGHRVHSTDPRVAVLFGMATEAGIPTDGIAFMRALEAEAAAQVKPLPMNIDGALAAVLHDLGFPPAAGHLLFIVGRVAGLTAEVAEEYAREKPMRIRFDVEYDGEPARPLESES
jgi:citrate synthase